MTQDDINALLKAFDWVLVGGNHLASALIGGGIMPDQYTRETAHELQAKGIEWYEMWCCWKSIMEARDMVDHGFGEWLGAVRGEDDSASNFR